MERKVSCQRFLSKTSPFCFIAANQFIIDLFISISNVLIFRYCMRAQKTNFSVISVTSRCFIDYTDLVTNLSLYFFLRKWKKSVSSCCTRFNLYDCYKVVISSWKFFTSAIALLSLFKRYHGKSAVKLLLFPNQKFYSQSLVFFGFENFQYSCLRRIKCLCFSVLISELFAGSSICL